MLNKKMISIFLLIVILLTVFSKNVIAIGNLNNITGFGNYKIEQDADGEIKVSVDVNHTAKWDRDHWKKQLDDLFKKYGKTITWFTGIATITLVVVFIWLCVKCAFVASDHWILKRQAMIALLWVGIGTALMGSTTLILVIFQNAFV